MNNKRLKATHNNATSNQCSKILSNVDSEISESHFCVLPNEVLEIIFSYLSPLDCVAISEAGIERVSNMNFKSVDFSSCQNAREESLTAFFRNCNVKFIKEINFNNLFCVKPSILQKCIVQCEHLTVLSILDCTFSICNLHCIFKHCAQLQELYLTVYMMGPSNAVYKNFYETVSVKKIYFHLLRSCTTFLIIHNVLKACPNAKDITLNFAPHSSTTSFPNITRFTHVGKIIHIDRRCLLKIVVNSRQGNISSVGVIIRQIKDNWNMLFGPKQLELDLSTFFSFNVPGFLQLQTAEREDMEALPSLPDSSLDTLSLLVTSNSDLLLKNMEQLKRITGKSLRHLSIKLYQSLLNVNVVASYDEPVMLQVLLPSIIGNSCNISVLNLSDLHHSSRFPFSNLYCLKKLKVLHLSACILKGSTSKEEACFEDKQTEFDDLIANCKNVEEFSMIGCLVCLHGPSDSELASICMWRQLSSLTLSKIFTFRLCDFLFKIANSCPRLKRLELSELGNRNVCHYIPNVIHILQKSKKLAFLRIYQKRFHPMNELFWKAVGSATSLEGMCLETCIDAAIQNKPIIDNLQKLPNLHLFHFKAFRVSKNLEKCVRQIMDKHNIQNRSVVISDKLQENCVGLHIPSL